MSCSGCKSSSKTAKGIMRQARKLKSLEPSCLDYCLSCEYNECTCESKLTIKASETVVENDMVVEGFICGNVKGTLIGNVCAGLIKGKVQLVSDPMTDIAIVSQDLITQIRVPMTNPITAFTGYLEPGSEGQLKIIHFISDKNGDTLTIELMGSMGNTGTLTLTSDTVTPTPSSAQLYFIAGAWYPYQIQNGTG